MTNSLGKLHIPVTYVRSQFKIQLKTQNKAVLPNSILATAINNIDEIYYNVKALHDGRLALGTTEGNAAISMNKHIVVLGKGDSIGFCDWFKHVMTFDSVNEYTTTKDYIKTQPRIIVPPLLLDPPMINTKRIVYNSVLGTVKGLNNEDAYLQNFKIDFNKISDLKLISPPAPGLKFTDNPNYKLTDSQITNNIKHGIHRMFADQVKPRSMNPLQVLVHATFSYRCDSCAIESNMECKCYLKSPELYAISQFIHAGKGIPFFILTSDSKSVKNPTYESISSMIPSIWYILCDLSLRTGAGAIPSSLAAGITKLWLDASTRSLFGEILGSFKKIKDIIPMICARTDFTAVEISKSNDIVGCHKAGPIGSYSSDDYRTYLDKHKLDFLFPNDIPSLTDEEGRWFINMIQYMTTPSIPIKTPISLSMGMSAQSTNEIGGMLQVPIEMVKIKDNYVPIRFDYEDADMDAMRSMLRDLLVQYPPELNNLESKFIEACTTNSAGVDPIKLAAIRKEILDELGPDNPDAKELAANAGVRIFDVLRVILKSLKSLDALLHEWDTIGVSGIRVQVGRRNRLIQMLASVFMCAPFLIKVILEDIITNSGIGATGKTTNDIRDTHEILYASGRELFILFADVTGMDTNTYGPQQRFLTEIITDYLKGKRELNIPYYLNKLDGVSQPIEVEKLTKNKDTGNWDKSREYVSVLEYFCYLDSTLIDEKRRVSDGYFFREILASNITFPSGSYKTSTQHTMLLILVYLRVKQIMEQKYARVGLKVYAQVLGDDQMAYSTTTDMGTKTKDIADEMQALINDILRKFAYVTDSGMGFCHGEFLKQVAYHGGPSPLGSRLAQYGCETGSSYALSNIERMKNACGVADELSARIRYPNYTKIIKRMAGMLLSYVGVKTKINDSQVGLSYLHHTQKAHSRRLGTMRKLNTKTRKKFTDTSNFVNDITWQNNYEEVIIIKILKGCWYCVPNIGVPHYPMQFQDYLKIDDNWLAFPSPFTLKCIGDLCKRQAVDINACIERNRQLIASSDSGLLDLLNTMPSLIKKAISAKIKTSGLAAITAMMLADPRHIPVSMSDKIDPKLLDFYGFSEGYVIEELLRTKLDKFEPGQAFRDTEAFGNSFLDHGKVNVSHLAAFQLRLKYGFSISDTVAYYNRIGARIRSAAAEKRDVTSITMALYQVFENGSLSNSIPPKLLDQLVFGDFSIFTTDITHEGYCQVSTYKTSGFGSGVPTNSIQAMYIDIFGLPRMHGSSLDAIRENIRSFILIEGAADDVINTLALVFRKYGKEALGLAYDAIGLAGSLKDKLERLFTEMGYEAFTFPFAQNPRKDFYYNFAESGWPGRLFVQEKSILSRHMQYALYLSVIKAQPRHLSQCVSIVPQAGLTIGMQV